MKRFETRFVRRKVKGAWRTVEIRVERKRSAAILDRLVRKHKLLVITK